MAAAGVATEPAANAAAAVGVADPPADVAAGKALTVAGGEPAAVGAADPPADSQGKSTTSSSPPSLKLIHSVRFGMARHRAAVARGEETTKGAANNKNVAIECQSHACARTRLYY